MPIVSSDRTGASVAQEIELSIVMPCLNEAETIEACVEKAIAFVRRTGVSAEVVVADNGSTDNSAALARAKGAHVIAVAEKGYGAALRAGIRAARGRYVVIGDADNSYDFSRLDAFVEQLRAGHDLVMGNRFRGGIAPDAMPPLHRYVGNPVLSFLGRTFFNVRIGDFHCGLRGFDRDRILALELHTAGMEFASEMVIAAALRGYSIVEVPTTLKKDGRSRPPHLRTWRDGWRHLRFLLMFSPRWLFLYPGFALILAGLVGALVLFPGPLRVGGISFGIHTFLVAAVAMLVGTQVIGFGLVAQRFAIANGFLPESRYWAKLLAAITVERGLVFAGLIGAAGLAGLIWSLTKWAALNFGPLLHFDVLRIMILSLTAIAGGVQIAFTSFLLGIMDLPLQRSRSLSESRPQS
jgi:glycosyltransferase involved in cell wall biosynthesis